MKKNLIVIGIILSGISGLLWMLTYTYSASKPSESAQAVLRLENDDNWEMGILDDEVINQKHDLRINGDGRVRTYRRLSPFTLITLSDRYYIAEMHKKLRIKLEREKLKGLGMNSDNTY